MLSMMFKGKTVGFSEEIEFMGFSIDDPQNNVSIIALNLDGPVSPEEKDPQRRGFKLLGFFAQAAGTEAGLEMRKKGHQDPAAGADSLDDSRERSLIASSTSICAEAICRHQVTTFPSNAFCSLCLVRSS